MATLNTFSRMLLGGVFLFIDFHNAGDFSFSAVYLSLENNHFLLDFTRSPFKTSCYSSVLFKSFPLLSSWLQYIILYVLEP